MIQFLKYLCCMFSSSNEVSWGRITASLLLCYVVIVQLTLIFIGYSADPAQAMWVAIDPFWRDVILGIFGISKGGETVQVYADKKKVAAKYDDSTP